MTGWLIIGGLITAHSSPADSSFGGFITRRIYHPANSSLVLCMNIIEECRELAQKWHVSWGKLLLIACVGNYISKVAFQFKPETTMWVKSSFWKASLLTCSPSQYLRLTLRIILSNPSPERPWYTLCYNLKWSRIRYVTLNEMISPSHNISFFVMNCPGDESAGWCFSRVMSCPGI